MAKQSLREIIEIDEDLCDGCGLCIPNCEEGALILVDGKVKLVEEARCDGAGACLGHCPLGALRIIQRTAEEFDEQFLPKAESEPKVEPKQTKPEAVVFRSAGSGLVRKVPPLTGGCPGSRVMEWKAPAPVARPQASGAAQPSELRQWPIQLHLLSPSAPFLHGRELLLAADCVAFSLGAFHCTLLTGRSLAVACPKLDDPSGYEEKLVQILAGSSVPALRVAIMEVPCCSGLLRLAQGAVQQASYEGEVEVIVVSRFGEILERRILSAVRPQASGTQNQRS